MTGAVVLSVTTSTLFFSKILVLPGNVFLTPDEYPLYRLQTVFAD